MEHITVSGTSVVRVEEETVQVSKLVIKEIYLRKNFFCPEKKIFSQ